MLSSSFSSSSSFRKINMASACVNIPISPPHPNTSFLNHNIPWLSPDLHDSPSDFEFRLVDHPISNILPADQLFSNGKLLTTTTATDTTTVSTTRNTNTAADTNRRKISDGVGDGGDGVEHYIFSPKAPRCSSRWREILGLRNKKISTPDCTKTTSSLSTTTSSSSKSLRFSIDEPTTKTTSARSLRFSTEENTKTTSSSKSIKRFLTKNTRTSTSDTSLSLPLLDRNSDSSSIDSLTDSMFSISTSTSRLSLSSLSSSTSSSTHDHDDLHRLSLDETRPRVTLLRPTPNPKPNPVSTRPVRRAQKLTRQGTGTGTGVSADSPRMNSAGKIVFQSLNRSSSSPSSFNGGPRYKHRGMERSYSANVRITPVLNVPVCSSLRGSSKSGGFGFGQLFTSSSSSTQKKDKGSGNNTHNGDKRRSLPVVM